MATSDQQHAAPDQEEITRLVSSASEIGRADGTPARKRGWARLHVGMHLDVTTDRQDHEDILPVIMHNISDGGFAFWLKRELRIDAQIWVREFSGDEPFPWLAAQVTHCTVGIRGYLIGAKFSPES